MKNHMATVHKGAGVWTITVHDKTGDVVFDMNGMTREQRGRFFGQFRKIINQKFGSAA